jgi:hypothetical protein
VARLVDERPRLVALAALALGAVVASTVLITRSVTGATEKQQRRAERADQRAAGGTSGAGPPGQRRQASAGTRTDARAGARPGRVAGRGRRAKSATAAGVAERWKARAP